MCGIAVFMCHIAPCGAPQNFVSGVSAWNNAPVTIRVTRQTILCARSRRTTVRSSPSSNVPACMAGLSVWELRPDSLVHCSSSQGLRASTCSRPCDRAPVPGRCLTVFVAGRFMTLLANSQAARLAAMVRWKGERRGVGCTGRSHQATIRIRLRAAAEARCCRCVLGNPRYRA